MTRLLLLAALTALVAAPPARAATAGTVEYEIVAEWNSLPYDVPSPEGRAYKKALMQGVKVDSKGNVDGLPNTLLEAMASGRAILASRVAGIPDVLSDGVEGLLVPPGEASSIRQGLLRLASSLSLRTHLGEGALRRVKRDLTWERVAATLEESYVQARTLAKR